MTLRNLALEAQRREQQREDAKGALERNAKENSYIAATAAAGVNSAVPQADKPDF